jgi:dinuclear metal center YbgI/SA1388 family protein
VTLQTASGYRQLLCYPADMFVHDVANALQTIAPLDFAAEWDNVGLLLGSRAWRADSVLLTIDLTSAVLREAIAGKANMIVSYHPPIFQPWKSITDATHMQQIALEAIAARIAVYSPHTALDAAPGGVNDWLARAVAGGRGDVRGDVRALDGLALQPESQQCKVITYCPQESVEQIRNGLAAVGAGNIGEYRLCSFEIAGMGTFLGGATTRPAVGQQHVLNRVNEIRLEMVCPERALALAVMSIRQFHPYEEPPIEIIRLQPHPQRNIGQGRRVVLDQAIGLDRIVSELKSHLSVSHLQVALAENGAREFKRIGLCAGAGGSLLNAALQEECEVFITGEMRHHDVLHAISRGCAVILAGHTNTERGYLRPLQERLEQMLPDVRIQISSRDADPIADM